jgi:hypothetical protein
MGGVCESGCHRYINNVSSITSYNRCNIPAPLPMEVRISRMDLKPGISYQIFIGRDQEYFRFEITDYDGVYAIEDIPPGVEIEGPEKHGYTHVTVYVKLVGNNIFRTIPYIAGDEYHVNFQDNRCPDIAASAQYFRKENGKLVNNLSSNKVLFPNSKLGGQNNSDNIPQILINAQTTLNGSDIGDAVFTIYDEFQYYDYIIPNNNCPPEQIPPQNIKQTLFRECCPYMVSVVKGTGETLLEKLEYLFNKGLVNLPNIYVFYEDIVLYGMAKYILSRLLFGKFNINYLLGKYNDKFLKKLSTSRFCKFTAFFESEPYNHYNDYFLYNN